MSYKTTCNWVMSSYVSGEYPRGQISDVNFSFAFSQPNTNMLWLVGEVQREDLFHIHNEILHVNASTSYRICINDLGTIKLIIHDMEMPYNLSRPFIITQLPITHNPSPLLLIQCIHILCMLNDQHIRLLLIIQINSISIIMIPPIRVPIEPILPVLRPRQLAFHCCPLPLADNRNPIFGSILAEIL